MFPSSLVVLFVAPLVSIAGREDDRAGPRPWFTAASATTGDPTSGGGGGGGVGDAGK
jgi:hypothetical protein